MRSVGDMKLSQMNVPDRFDVYSAGLIFLQLVKFQSLQKIKFSLSLPETCSWPLSLGL